MSLISNYGLNRLCEVRKILNAKMSSVIDWFKTKQRKVYMHVETVNTYTIVKFNILLNKT